MVAGAEQKLYKAPQQSECSSKNERGNGSFVKTSSGIYSNRICANFSSKDILESKSLARCIGELFFSR